MTATVEYEPSHNRKYGYGPSSSTRGTSTSFFRTVRLSDCQPVGGKPQERSYIQSEASVYTKAFLATKTKSSETITEAPSVYGSTKPAASVQGPTLRGIERTPITSFDDEVEDDRMSATHKGRLPDSYDIDLWQVTSARVAVADLDDMEKEDRDRV